MFSHCKTPQDIKNLYRKMAFKYHPDHGGDNDMMKKINAAYHTALAAMHGFTAKGHDGKKHTYYYNQKVEQAVMDKVEELLTLNLTGCTIEIIGTWIWISGGTKPHREKLRTSKCQWHDKRGRWFWHGPQRRSKYNKHINFAGLRNTYGVAGRWDIEENRQIA